MDQLRSGLPRHHDQLLVAEQRQQFEPGPATGLHCAEHIAFPAQLQVEAGELETIGGGGDRNEAFPGGGARRRVGHQQAQPRMLAAAHPAAQLVQLADPEPLRIHDDHDGRVGHVHADLNNGGSHQHIDLARGERPHHGVFVIPC